MNSVDLKLKQASAVLGVPSKEVQNLVQFRVLAPRKRNGVYRFDREGLLKAKVALYLKQSIGASTVFLVRFTEAVSRAPGFATGASTVVILSRPGKGLPAVQISVPVGQLARELDERLPLAEVCRDLPRGRRRAGWRAEFEAALQEAARSLSPATDADVVATVRSYRRSRRARPEVDIVTGPAEASA